MKAKLIAVLMLLWPYVLLGWHGLFGVWHWDQPAWIGRLGVWSVARAQYLQSHLWQSALAVLLAAGLGGGSWYGYHWWQNRPQPVKIDFSVTAPERMKIEEKNAKPNPLLITFTGSVAPLNLAGKEIKGGLTISPTIAGVWRWLDDRRLQLQPDKDWPVGQIFEVTFEKNLLAEQILLARDEFTFNAPAFTANLDKAEFYQDPLDPALKKAIFQIRFSHPVDAASLEEAVEMTLVSAQDAKIKPEPLKFTASYDKLGLTAFIHSRPLAIPQHPQQVTFLLQPGVKAKGSKAATASELHSETRVPGLYDERMVDDMQLTTAPNLQSGQQEQILIVNTSVPIHEQEMAKAVQLWQLPEFDPKTPEDQQDEPTQWYVDLVGADALKTAKQVDLHAIPAENEYGTSHAFRLDADVGRYLYVTVSKDLRSFGGYRLPKPVRNTLLVPEFPKELHIMGEGSLLTLSGEKKIAVMTRDVPGLKIELGRLLPDQLQHLMTQTSGDFAHPEFNGDLGQDNLSERFELKLPLTDAAEGKPHYQAVDLKHYLVGAEGQPKRGIFLLTAKGYDPDKDRQDEASDDSDQPQEKRLVLVTDLGMIVKNELDGSQVVFVQSIQSGEPQEDVEVSVIAKNGLTVMKGRTDGDGKVRFAKLAGLEREREPVLYLASDHGDMSFLPLGRDDRDLNFSRFDIGGAANALDAGELSAYLFSDRGIYRPGDEFHIGMIVKAEKWDIPLAGLPLEAEIVDPRGLAVKKTKLNLGPGGFNELTHETLDSSPTGIYTVNLYTIKNAKTDKFLGSVSVKVEEFLPDRMKAAIGFSKPATDGWLHPKDLQATVNVQNLYGAPAEDRTVEASLTLSPRLPEFPRYKDYRFHDPHFAEQGYDQDLNPAQTDEKGNAVFNLGLEKYAKATYKLHLLARAFEAKGGRSVAAEADVLISDLPYLIGYKADGELDYVARDAQRNVELIAIDPNLQKTAVAELTLELIERKALSVLMRQDDGTYRYESRIKDISLSKTPLALPQTGHTFALDSKTPGDYVYQVKNAEGVALAKIAYSVAGLGNVSRTLDRNAELQLTLDKQTYEPGETIKVNIRAPYTGSGLITIERDKVYASAWFHADTQSSVQTIEVPPDLAGNGYVSVQFIRDPGSDEIFMSPLSYGVAPFKVSLSAHAQPLTLAAPEKIKPGETLPIKLTSVGPTRVVVFAADEGILQVARYKNPDPLGHFFRKRMLEVDTKQILDLILPEFTKLLASAAGGDGEEEEAASYLNPFKRKRDKPAVYWSGIVDVDGEKTFNYDVPETFNGALKIFAVAVSDLKIASIAGQTKVRGDLIITPNVPSMVAPGDEFVVSTGVANHVEGSGADAKVNVTLIVPPQLKIKGNAEQTLAIAEGHEGAATFTVSAAAGNKAVLGDAELRFSAASAGKSAKLSSHLSLRPAVPRMANLKLGAFKGKQEITGLRQMHPEYRKVSAGLSVLPLVAMPGLTAYLDNFSHYCTEQLTSKAMPTIVLHKRPEFAEQPEAGDVGNDLLRLFSVLRTRQNSEGGFGLWSASPEAHEFASVYAIHMLLEASANGFPVPADMLEHGLNYLQTLSASSSSDLSALRTRAYAAYLLTRQGNVTTAALTGIREALRANYKAENWQNDLVAVYLAASYQLLQQAAVADELIKVPAAQLGKFAGAFDFNNYYDPLIQQGQTLYVLAKHFPDRLKKMPTALFATIGKAMQENRFNTLSSAYLLLAFDAYLDVLPPEIAQKLSITAIDAGGQRQVLALPQNFAPRAPFPLGTTTLEFAGDGGIPLYYAVSESGFDMQPPGPAMRDGLEIIRSYLDDDGKELDKIPLGAEVTVSIRARAIDRDYIGNVAIIDLLPGGFEAVLQNPGSNEPEEQNDEGDSEESFARWQDRLKTGGNWTADYIDVREDRVLLYGTLSKNMAEYRYRAKATAAGVFNVPPVYAEAMYVPTIRAHSGADMVRVDEK